MNQMIKDNYDPKKSLLEIIMDLPDYLCINEAFKAFVWKSSENNENFFSIDCLITIYEIFEALIWDDIKKNLSLNYNLTIGGEVKIRVLNYFENDKNKEKLISKNNLTSALRKLISRYLAGLRQSTDIRTDQKLNLFLIKSEFWNSNLEEDDKFLNEFYEIISDEIIVGSAFNLYNILDGDTLLKKNVIDKIFGNSIDEEEALKSENNLEPDNIESEEDSLGELEERDEI